MRKAARTYLELALGVTDTSTKKVRRAVEEAVGKGGATADQIKALTSDLMAARSANREGIAKLVRFEVDRALGVVGLATADEVSELTARIRDLERQLRDVESQARASTSYAGSFDADEDRSYAQRLATQEAMARRATASATTPDAAVTLPTVADDVDAPTPKPTKSAKAARAAKTTGVKSAGAKTPTARTAATKATAKATTATPAKATPAKATTAKATTATPAKATTANVTVAKAAAAKGTSARTAAAKASTTAAKVAGKTVAKKTIRKAQP